MGNYYRDTYGIKASGLELTVLGHIVKNMISLLWQVEVRKP